MLVYCAKENKVDDSMNSEQGRKERIQSRTKKNDIVQGRTNEMKDWNHEEHYRTRKNKADTG